MAGNLQGNAGVFGDVRVESNSRGGARGMVVLALLGCGANSRNGAAPPRPSTSPSTAGILGVPTTGRAPETPPTIGPPVSGVLTLTGPDAGGIATVVGGTRIHVQLSGTPGPPAYVVSAVQSSDSGVLLPGAASRTANGGVDAWFVATADGRTTLSASNDPTCLSAVPPCAVPSFLWSVTVVVDG